MLSIEVIGNADVEEVVAQLRHLDGTSGQLRIHTSSAGGGKALAAFVVATPSLRVAGQADVVLSSDEDLEQQVETLWRNRLQPFASGMSGAHIASYPAVMHPYDPDWPVVAERRINRLRQALGTALTYEHIGSTSVPGLAAKAVIDLQVRVPELPELDDELHQLGYLAAKGSRPDSPGVYRDVPRGSEVVPDEVWAKRLFYSPDPELPSILHIRRADSPWGKYTVLFRDWLRAHPAEKDRYQRLKMRLADEHAQDSDYDDYTRAKTQFFNEVQEHFEQWGRQTAGAIGPSNQLPGASSSSLR